MLFSLPSWDYFQCKSLLLECAVLIMTQKLLWLLLWGMISFCSNAQRNVLLPNCCSSQLICLFFSVSGEMRHSCSDFYLSGLPGVGRGRAMGVDGVREGTWRAKPRLTSEQCPNQQGQKCLQPFSAENEKVPSWDCFSSFLLFCFLRGSDFPHPQEGVFSTQNLLVELAGTCSWYQR